MTEQQRKYIIVGGFGVGAVVLLAVLSSSKNTAPPSPTAAPGSPPPGFDIPAIPAAVFPAPAPISIVSAPVFNAPDSRPPFFPTNPVADDGSGKTGCDCSGCPTGTQYGVAPFNQTTIDALNARFSFAQSRFPVRSFDVSKA